jgi:DNA-binding NtrC family response regulator
MSLSVSTRLFVVDDEPTLVSTLATILNASGYRAVAFTSAEQALHAAETDTPSILFSDVHMPGMNGIELAIKFKTLYPACKILLFSGFPATADLLDEAKSQGHEFQVLAKPMHPTELLTAIAHL